MAQGNGDGIRRVIGLRHGGQVQQPFGHILDLVLGGISVTNHGLLDLHGLVFKDRQPGLPDGQQNHTAALGNIDAGGDVLTEEQLFNSHHFRLGYLKQLLKKLPLMYPVLTGRSGVPESHWLFLSLL